MKTKQIIEDYLKIPEKDRRLSDHIKAAIAGLPAAEMAVRRETGKGKNGWAIVTSLSAGNKRSIISRHDTLASAFRARSGANQIVVAEDNLPDDSNWTWGDIRHLMISSNGWTSVVPC